MAILKGLSPSSGTPQDMHTRFNFSVEAIKILNQHIEAIEKFLKGLNLKNDTKKINLLNSSDIYWFQDIYGYKAYLKEASGSFTYEGPFAVSITDTGINVAAGSFKGGYWSKDVTATDIAFASIEGTIVYGSLEYDSEDSSYNAEILTGTSVPVSSDTGFYCKIAELTLGSSVVESVKQTHFGDIDIVGRLF